MPAQKSKQLLVEGVDDLLSVVGLMEHHVPWPRDKNRAPVFIENAGSVDQILDATYMSTKLKESGLEILGIMVDADDQPARRWASFCNVCKYAAPLLPAEIPKSGLIIDCPIGLRLGFWMMPDCSSDGMLETFLRHLIPAADEPLWAHAQHSSTHARALGASYRDAHIHKTQIHTWLAWQDPPGERLGMALTRRILDPHAHMAAAFVSWFKELYKL
jgi:hypothetical protein